MMEFKTFEEALKVCMTADEGSEDQDKAMIYCLNNAPDDLKDKLQKLLSGKKENHCDCGCQTNEL